MILKEIKEFYEDYEWIVDPHTATAVSEMLPGSRVDDSAAEWTR